MLGSGRCLGGRHGNTLQYQENPMGWGAWWATVHEFAKSRTWPSEFTSLTSLHWRNVKPLQCSCLENPMDRGAWWAMVHGVSESWTQLKWLSMPSLSVVSNSLQSYRPQPARLPCPWDSRQGHWSGLPFPTPGKLTVSNYFLTEEIFLIKWSAKNFTLKTFIR